MAPIPPIPAIAYHVAPREARSAIEPESEAWYAVSSDIPRDRLTLLPSPTLVDANGRPRVMYHAGLREVDRFNRLHMREERGRVTIDQVGIWFSDSPGKNGAGKYISDTAQGAVIYPVLLDIKNPWTVSFTGMWRAALRLSGQDPNLPIGAYQDGRVDVAKSIDALRAWLSECKLDGIRIKYDPGRDGDEFKGQDVWVALEPEQIWSVWNDGPTNNWTPTATPTSPYSQEVADQDGDDSFERPAP